MGRPTQPKVTATNPKSSLSLNSQPVSLLWAHQLRRENALLLSKIDFLSSKLDSVVPDVEATGSGVKKVANELEKLTGEFRVAECGLKTCERHVDEYKSRLGEVEDRLESQSEISRKSIDGVLGKVTEVEKGAEETKQHVEQILESMSKKDQLDALTATVKELGKRIMTLSKRDNVLVKDSLEGVGRLMGNNETSKRLSTFHEQRSRDETPLRGYLDADQDSEEGESDKMLTLHAKNIAEVLSSAVGDIDLDENVATISYAGHWPHFQPQPADSLVMLPPFSAPKPAPYSGIDNLKQGRHQTWGSYLVQGKVVLASFTKRKEGAVVEAFVKGIFDVEYRFECEKWLNQRHWIWDDIEKFADWYELVEPSEEMETQSINQLDKQMEHEGNKNRSTTTMYIPVDSKKMDLKAATPAPEMVSKPDHIIKKAVVEPSKKQRRAGNSPLEPRRSKRLLSQEPDSQQQVQQKTSAQSQKALRLKKRKTPSVSQNQAQEVPPSQQPDSGPKAKARKTRNCPDQDATKKPTTTAEQITPPEREEEPYTLPSPVRPVTIAPVQALSRILPQLKNIPTKKRKRDYEERLVMQTLDQTIGLWITDKTTKTAPDPKTHKEAFRTELELLQIPPCTPSRKAKAAIANLEKIKPVKIQRKIMKPRKPSLAGSGSILSTPPDDTNHGNIKHAPPITESQVHKAGNVRVIQRVTIQPIKKIKVMKGCGEKGGKRKKLAPLAIPILDDSSDEE